MIAFLKLIIYTPLYNSLVVLLDILPGADIGLAIIILTLIVKLLLYPLSKKSTIMQVKMKKHEAELAKIKEKHKDQKEQAMAMMEFYKKYEINPFSSIFTLLIQIPIIYSLYYIFVRSGLPVVNTDLLYSFVKAPDVISTTLLGFIDVAGKSLWLALLAGITSFLQMRLSSASNMQNLNAEAGSFGDALSKTMSFQMKFIMPAIVFLISWRISGAVALYWAVGNVITIVQDYYTKKKLATL
jgi:YidC/Oxa1 family membrane protein insertase